MNIEKYFELRDKGLNGSFVFRIFNKKTNELAQVIVDENDPRCSANLYKDYSVIILSICSRNPSNTRMEILTFNVPKEKRAYKAIIDLENRSLAKIFSSNGNKIWNRELDVTNELKILVQSKREYIQSYEVKQPSECKMVFLKPF